MLVGAAVCPASRPPPCLPWEGGPAPMPGHPCQGGSLRSCRGCAGGSPLTFLPWLGRNILWDVGLALLRVGGAEWRQGAVLQWGRRGRAGGIGKAA